MKPPVFHPEALAEFQEQAVFYEERSAGLGERFADQVESAVSLAASMPSIGSPHLHGTRRVFPKDFPHSVVYLETTDSVVILAVAPFRRKPAYWRHRK
ncbi:MAG: type II toxin-antitoxin system RelE/ParE family toxin [Rubrivivax sp.]